MAQIQMNQNKNNNFQGKFSEPSNKFGSNYNYYQNHSSNGQHLLNMAHINEQLVNDLT